MNVAVWDTYVKRQNGTKMHFDIIVPENLKEEKTIFMYGQEYLKNKDIRTKELTTKECEFCHIEKASDTMIRAIESKGYYIVEMKNCDE